MTDLSEEVKSLVLTEDIFKDIKFFITGDVHEKVYELLKNGGAERMNYFSDYVNLLIVGENFEENDIQDALDLYEIPAVLPKWIFMSAKLKKLVSKTPYLHNTKLFSNKVFCLSGVQKDLSLLWAIITFHGGQVQLNLNKKINFLVATTTESRKYEKAIEIDSIIIVTPDWVLESVKNKGLVDPVLFHPKLVLWPKPVKHESTTAITGFEPDNVPEEVKPEEKPVSDSTQALLEKLKQRMPWNQPASSKITTGETVGPPNVVAPSFLNKGAVRQPVPQSPQGQLVPPNAQGGFGLGQAGVQQVPRSVVHHTPQGFNPQQSAVRGMVQQRGIMRPQLQQQQQQMLQQQRQVLQQRMPQQIVQRQMMIGQQPQIVQQQQMVPGQQQIVQNQHKIIGPQIQQQQIVQNQQINQQMVQNQQQQIVQNEQQQIVQNQQQQIVQNQQQQIVQNQQQQIVQNQQQQLIQNQQVVQNPQQQQIVQNPQQQIVQNQQQLAQIQQLQLKQQQQQQMMQNQQFLQQQQQQMMQNQQLLQQKQQLFVQNQQQQQNQQQFLQQQFQQQPQPQSQGFQQQQQPQQEMIEQQGIVQNQSFAGQQIVQAQQQPQQMINQPIVQNQIGMQKGLPQQMQMVRGQFPVGQQQQQMMMGQRPPHLWQQGQVQGQGTQPVVGQQQQQITIRHPGGVLQQGQRIQWSPGQQQGQVQGQPGMVPHRQVIQLDAQTHHQLQKLPPEQQVLFVAKLQKQRQILRQRGAGGGIVIRGSVPPGLNPQQQVQWLQQQAKQQGLVLGPNFQQQNITPGNLTPQPNAQGAPGLSPIQTNTQFTEQQQNQLRLRYHQLQLQREQAQKNQMVQQQQQQQPSPQVPPPGVKPIAPVEAGQAPPPPVVAGPESQQSLVVNSKTKTALANMLNIRLQSGGSSMGPAEGLAEPSAAGTLRLMTAQHNAALSTTQRPQDMLALQQQRRVINGPNGEIIRPPGRVTTPGTPQGEPPNLQFCHRPPGIPQHRPGPFYGHNPNLKLPPDLFLLGCIFVVVEIERYLDESIPGWQKKIEKHGGEIEKQYCSRVTHVLCETQRHGVVMQALRDLKRCVTIYWLSDVIRRKQVLPPWTALHLPIIYLDTTPASKHLISLSGFTGSERIRVKHMISYTGAKFTTYFSKHNTVLITAKAEGQKFNYAKKWGIPTVNIQWLTDIMLGNFTALNQIDHVMYQQFPVAPNFSFDPKLVPNLMHAWKMPINISQESYERVKRSGSPVLAASKPKKPKIEETDENDNFEEYNGDVKILFSMCTDLPELKKMVKELGGGVAKDTKDCTHLVMPQLVRSNKLLFCLAKSCHILPDTWLRESYKNKQFLPENNFTFDTIAFDKEYKCDFTKALFANKQKLFEGRCFWVTPSVFPSKKAIEDLIRTCGGTVERIRRTQMQIETTNANNPYSYLIITHKNDIHLVADLLKTKKDKITAICNVEVVFSAILKQVVEVEPFAVKVL